MSRRSLRGAAAPTVAVLLALCTVLAGCSSGGSGGHGPQRATQRAVTSSAKPAAEPSSSAPSADPAATPQQLAGRRVIYSYPGTTVPRSLLDRIKAGRAAGVIFFKENVTGKSQITSVIKQLKAANAQSGKHEPLLLLTDQEGGQIRRLPGGPDPSAKQDGAAADPIAASRAAGAAAGRNLASVGMNVNAAPVLGVHRKPGDFLDQFGRSFSDDPKQVAGDAAAFIGGQQGAGVAATAKHFPGLGAAPTDANTDEGPVTLDVPLDTLRKVDEAPYPKAISDGVKLVMPSWAVYPALDPDHPAGLSAKVLRDELRGRLGFNGVTMSDALEAKALKGYGSSGQRAVAAGKAGMDLVLASARSVDQGDQAAAGLAHGLESGQLDRADFEASVNRVDALRKGLPG